MKDDDYADTCIACLVPFKEGDEYLPELNGGLIHFACCGPEREGFYKNDDEPLGPDDPIPTPLIWSDPTTLEGEGTR